MRRKEQTMKRRIMAAAAALIIAITSFAACSEKTADSSAASSAGVSSIAASDIDVSIKAVDYEVGYDEASACKVSFDGESADVDGSGAQFKDGVLTITEAGTYILSGKLDGRVVVNTGKNKEVRIVLNGAEITSSDNAALAVLQADKVSITLAENTQNKLTDGSEYKTSDDESKVDACLYSQDDLTINGSGSLEVTGNYKHGIVSKDDLVVTGGKIKVTAKNTAMTGKDSVKISDGEFDISAGTNGIKSDNSEDSSKGYIALTGGSYKIVSNNDGIEASGVLKIDGGDFDITTGGGSKNSSTKSDGMPNGDWQNDMQKGGGGMRGRQMQGGEMPQMPEDFAGGKIEAAASVEETANTESSDSSDSAKALKSDSDIEITGGSFNIDSADDSVHSNANISISGGKLEAASGDDGIHADKELSISGGEITITKSYEGIEGMNTTISGGTVDVTANDDGINCSGGSDTGSEGRMGRDQFASQDGVYLKITGGNITVNSNGDGLDSNGDLFVEGGTTVVYGPTNSGNGALDYNGSAKITGGSVIAMGAAGMEQNFSDGSSQCSVLCDFETGIAAGSELTIKDSGGNVVFTVKNPKNWQGVVFSSSDIRQGETYTLTAGSQTQTIEVTSVSTSNSKGNQFGGGRMR